MGCSTTDLHHQKSFRLRHEDDKLFSSRRLSKQTSKPSPSFTVYYGDVSSTVPFTWESTPGTPKHKSSEYPNIPPLTPPPSYFTTNLKSSSKNHSRSKLLFNNLLRSVNPVRLGISSSHSSSLSSLSSQSWSSSAHSDWIAEAPSNCVRKRRRFSSWGSSYDSKSDENPRGGEVSCFGTGKRNIGERTRSGYSALLVKKALLSIVGRGSSA